MNVLLESGLLRGIAMKTLYTIIFLAIALTTGACSGDKSNSSTHENVFKTETDAVKKAQQVESQVLKQAEQQKQAIEQQTQ